MSLLEELIEICDETDTSWNSFCEAVLYKYDARYSSAFAELESRYITVEEVDNYGGEGLGDEYWIVFRLTKGEETMLLRVDGYYASYAGGEYHGPPYEVEPVEVTVTEYRSKK